MPSVDVLIPNRNSCEAVQLCVESVIAHTPTRPVRIVVYDDASTSQMDIEYLRDRRDRGWIELSEGHKRIGHGKALNALVNHFCRADYAVILDSDVEILNDGG